KNSARLITEGLWAMLRNLAPFTVAGFIGDTKKLLETARLLGSVRKQARYPVLTRFKQVCFGETGECSAVAPAIDCDNQLDILKERIISELTAGRQLGHDANTIFSLQYTQLRDGNKRAFKR